MARSRTFGFMWIECFMVMDIIFKCRNSLSRIHPRTTNPSPNNYTRVGKVSGKSLNTVAQTVSLSYVTELTGPLWTNCQAFTNLQPKLKQKMTETEHTVSTTYFCLCYRHLKYLFSTPLCTKFFKKDAFLVQNKNQNYQMFFLFIWQQSCEKSKHKNV